MGTALQGVVDDHDGHEHRAPCTTGRAHEDRRVSEWLSGFRAENTRAAYARDLAHFREYLAASGLELLSVARVHVDAYVHGFTLTGASAATVARRLSAVSSFYRRMVQDGQLERAVDLLQADVVAWKKKRTPEVVIRAPGAPDKTRGPGPGPVVTPMGPSPR